MNAKKLKWGFSALMVFALLSEVQVTQAQPLLTGRALLELSVNCPPSFTDSALVEAEALPLNCSALKTPKPTKPPKPTKTPAPVGTTQPIRPTQTPVTIQPCPEGLHDSHHWHPPIDASGCAFGHEHGDAPPQWALSSTWPPMFTHPGNTPTENQLKHTSFKGFTLIDDGVELYVIMHLDTNPNGQSSRFHSYQAWAKDAAGGVSYWDLWLDYGEGDNTGPNLRHSASCGPQPNVRPIMLVNYPECSVNFETWYNSPRNSPRWGWGFGFSVSAQYYNGPRQGESSSADLAAINAWLPTGLMNGERRIEATWNSRPDTPRGTFYATQFGTLVSGPKDPVCGTSKTFGSKTYTVLCLQQYIAPTMTVMGFPNNSIQKRYDMTGVRLPN